LARGGAANLALVELTKAAGRIRFNLAFAAMFETRGRIFHSMRQYAKAVEDFENVFRLQPPHYDLAPLHFAWGQSLWQLGAREEARGQFERAAELRPDLPAAIRVMEWFNSRG